MKRIKNRFQESSGGRPNYEETRQRLFGRAGRLINSDGSLYVKELIDCQLLDTRACSHDARLPRPADSKRWAGSFPLGEKRENAPPADVV